MPDSSKPAIRCPICKKEVAWDDPYLPFCSDRCRIIDLGNWASEKYVIPAPLEPGDDELEIEGDDEHTGRASWHQTKEKVGRLGRDARVPQKWRGGEDNQ